MAISKVVYGARTLIDLTSDTVTAADLATGKTAHDASGELITGTGSAGGSGGTATAADILEGKTAFVNGQLITGEMHDMTLNDGYYHIDNVYYWGWIVEGYHDGSEEVKIATNEVEKIIPENIRSGVDILGVHGELKGLAWEEREYTVYTTQNYHVEYPNADNDVVANLVYDAGYWDLTFDEYAVTEGNVYFFAYDGNASFYVTFFSPTSMHDYRTITNVVRIAPVGKRLMFYAPASDGYVIMWKHNQAVGGTYDTWSYKATLPSYIDIP